MAAMTKLTPANTTKSLRTTVPMSIVKQMNLTKSDYLVWELEKVGGNWIATIEKISIMKKKRHSGLNAGG